MRKIWLFVALSVAAPVQAADWQEMFVRKDGEKWSVDVDTLRLSDDIVTAWTQREYPKPNKDNPLKTARFKYEFNCPERRHRAGLMWGELPNGETMTDQAEEQWEETIPGTDGDHQLVFICEFAKRMDENGLLSR